MLTHDQLGVLEHRPYVKTDKEAAELAGVSTRAVAKWKQKDPEFLAEYEALKQRRLDGIAERQTEAADLASTALLKEIRNIEKLNPPQRLRLIQTALRFGGVERGDLTDEEPDAVKKMRETVEKMRPDGSKETITREVSR